MGSVADTAWRGMRLLRLRCCTCSHGICCRRCGSGLQQCPSRTICDCGAISCGGSWTGHRHGSVSRYRMAAGNEGAAYGLGFAALRCRTNCHCAAVQSAIVAPSRVMVKLAVHWLLQSHVVVVGLASEAAAEAAPEWLLQWKARIRSWVCSTALPCHPCLWRHRVMW